jgi:hypothetical protein
MMRIKTLNYFSSSTNNTFNVSNGKLQACFGASEDGGGATGGSVIFASEPFMFTEKPLGCFSYYLMSIYW